MLQIWWPTKFLSVVIRYQKSIILNYWFCINSRFLTLQLQAWQFLIKNNWQTYNNSPKHQMYLQTLKILATELTYSNKSMSKSHICWKIDSWDYCGVIYSTANDPNTVIRKLSSRSSFSLFKYMMNFLISLAQKPSQRLHFWFPNLQGKLLDFKKMESNGKIRQFETEGQVPSA